MTFSIMLLVPSWASAGNALATLNGAWHRVWLAMVTLGAFYSVIPQIWGRTAIYSSKLVEWHFWLALAGLLTYVFSLWNAGITQGLMWRAYNASGALNYSFIESMEAMRPYYIAHVLGGALFLAGICVGAVNIWLTIRGAQDTAPYPPSGGVNHVHLQIPL